MATRSRFRRRRDRGAFRIRGRRHRRGLRLPHELQCSFCNTALQERERELVLVLVLAQVQVQAQVQAQELVQARVPVPVPVREQEQGREQPPGPVLERVRVPVRRPLRARAPE